MTRADARHGATQQNVTGPCGDTAPMRSPPEAGQAPPAGDDGTYSTDLLVSGPESALQS